VNDNTACYITDMKKILTIIFISLLALLFLYAQSNKAPAKEDISASLHAWKLEQEIFEYGDFKLSYRDSKNDSETDTLVEQQEIIVLLHGYPTSSYDWHLVWENLSKDHRLIALDMLGYGFSDKPDDLEYSISLQTDIQQALLSKLGVNEVHLLTHDYGDNVAQELLARTNQPDALQIKSLVLLNGGLFPDVYEATTIQSLLRSPIGPLVSKLANGAIFHKNFNKVFGSANKLTNGESNDHWYLVCYNNGNNINHLLTHAADDRERNRDRWLNSLMNKDVPILFINGLDDPVSGKATVERYEVLVPNPNVVKLAGVGHYPHLEVPDIVIEEFRKFVK